MRKWAWIFFLASVGLTLALVYSLRSRPALGYPTNNGTFFDTGQALGNRTSLGVALGDLDGNPGLDAFVANGSGASLNTVWLNNGAGTFTGNGQSLGSADSQDVALADIDGANGLDAIVANTGGTGSQVWLNDGSGQFSAGQTFPALTSRGVGLGNLDGDGDPDVFFANQNGNTVWLNQSGVFTDTGQSLGSANSFSVSLGDLDGDNDLDAFVANGGGTGQPDAVWINQGGDQGGVPGFFQDSGQSLGFTWTYDVALGDLDGDGDLDAFTANWFPTANQVWINQGGIQGGTEGVFLDSGQSLGSSASLGVSLADVDGDTDLDSLVANNFPDGIKVWFNNGSGIFSDSGQALGTDATHYEVALGDLDGDNDPDAFSASFGPNRVYRNGSVLLPQATFAVERETNDDGDEVYYYAGTGNALVPVTLSSTYTDTLEVHTRIEDQSNVMTTTLPFEPGIQLQYLNLINPNPDPNQVLTMTLSVTLEGVPPTPADVTDELLFVFIDGGQGLSECILCYIEWLGQLVGIDPIFDQLFFFPLSAQKNSPLWPYYTALFDANAPEMSSIMATNPPLLWDALNVIDDWTPAVQALSNGSGSSYIASEQMVNDLVGLVDSVKQEASPALALAIQHEEDALDLPSLSGMNMDQFWDEMVLRRPIESLYISISIR